MCWESGGCGVRENLLVLHIVWKGLLVGSPDVTQWGDLRRSRSLGARHVHADIPVEEAALENHDAPRVNVAFDYGITLDFDALGRGHGSDDASAEDDFLRLYVALDDARSAHHDLPGAPNGPLHRSLDLEDSCRLDVTNDLHAGCYHGSSSTIGCSRPRVEPYPR